MMAFAPTSGQVDRLLQRDQRGGRLHEQDRGFRDRVIEFTDVVEIVATDAHDLAHRQVERTAVEITMLIDHGHSSKLGCAETVPANPGWR